jgi:hypothetical protein
MYTYSFVNKNLIEKSSAFSKEELNMNNLVPMKNALSEDLTHLR